MSVLTLDSGIRRARKTYRCGLCCAVIEPGEHYAFQSNVYDGHAYTWRDCLACERDGIISYVNQWCDPDGGVDFEHAYQWATDAIGWPTVYPGAYRGRPMKAGEHTAARNWLARADRLRDGA